MSQPQLSVVVPVFNERDNVTPLINEITTALRGQIDFEIVYIDDHSRDDTLAVLQALKAVTPELRVLHHVTQSGQSTAVRNGVKHARAPWIATLDGDGQNDPADLPGMLALVRNAGQQQGQGEQVTLVAGHRVNRRDTASKRWASRFANGLRSRLLKDATPDTGCGLKLIHRAAFLRLPYFDHMHRFIPALIQRHHGRMIVHPVHHRHRQAGVSNYGNLDRALVGILDLFGVWWLVRRTRLNSRPEEMNG